MANTKKRTKTKAKPPVWSESNKARVIAWVEKWRGLLLLNGHHINVEFSNKARAEEDRDNSGCAAEMLSNFPYMSGHKMTVFPAFLNEPDEGEAERKIIHELAHIITYPQRELVRRMFQDQIVTVAESKNTCEATTDWIANIAWALYEENR